MDKSIYSWESSDFKVQKKPDFLLTGTFIWVFNWHEIPHLGLSVEGNYFSISVQKTQRQEHVQKIWRLTEIKSIPLFLVEIKNVCLTNDAVDRAFSQPIQAGETCLVPLRSLFGKNDDNIQTLSNLLSHLEKSNQIAGFQSNDVLSSNKLTLYNYNKSDVLDMITNKIHVYEARK